MVEYFWCSKKPNPSTNENPPSSNFSPFSHHRCHTHTHEMSAAGPSKARLLELTQLSKRIFHESFNPTQTRRGSAVLRGALRGPAIKEYYYPSQFLKFKQLKAVFPDLYLVDTKEQYRLDINNEYVAFILSVCPC